MKVLVWYWGRNGAGPRYTKNISRALIDQGLDVYLSFSTKCELYEELLELKRENFIVNTFSGWITAAYASLFLPLLKKRFLNFLISNEIKMVLCPMHHVWNPCIARELKKQGIKYVTTVHDFKQHLGEENLILDWLAKKDIQYADYIISLSNYVKNQIHNYGITQKTKVIPHGVFEYASPIVRRYTNGSCLKLLFFGRIHEYKGIDILLDAFSIVKKTSTNVSLSIYGNGDLSPYIKKLKKNPEVTVVNRWIGEDEIGEIFNTHDICVLPYIDGSQSGVIPTALIAGMPVIATPVAGLREQLGDKRLGQPAKDVTAEALALRIMDFLNDQTLLEKRSIASLDYAKTTLSWNSVAERTITVFKELAHD